MKKVIFFDLDNTIYDVSSVADKMLSSLFNLIKKSGEFKGDFKTIKNQIMRKPLQTVAMENGFSKNLLAACIDHLKDLVYTGEIYPYDDFLQIKKLPLEKFLITSGFTKMQMSKVDGMKLNSFFKEIYIVDFMHSNKTKKDVFQEIMKKYHYSPAEILVVGDDLHSEIKAAIELGID